MSRCALIAVLGLVLPGSASAELSPQRSLLPFGCPQGTLSLYGRCQDPAGPGKRTVFPASWGVAFDWARETGHRAGPPIQISTQAPPPRIRQAGEAFQRGTLSVTPGRQVLTVTRGQARFEFHRTASGLTVSAAGEHIVYRRTDRGLTVTGPRGITRFRRTVSGIEIDSPAGLTTVADSPLHGRSISGVALGLHPYTGRLATFPDETGGVAIDLWHLAGFDPGAFVGAALVFESALVFRP